MRQIRILSILVILAVVSVESLARVRNCSTFERSSEQVLSRKKRFLIFNKGAQVIHTSYFGKQLVARFPRGFNWILELDMFFPLPFEPRVITLSKDLLFGKSKPKPIVPIWLQNQPKTPSYSTYKATPMPPTTPMKMVPNDYLGPWNSYPGEIFVPPFRRRSWDVYNASRSEANYWLNNQLTQNSDQYYSPRGRSLKLVESKHNDPDPRWNNIYAHKDRKELFEIIRSGYEKTGADSTACLQRTICEAKHFLLPKGKSLLHDLFRLIFTYPMHADDGWAEAARVDKREDCMKVYGAACPMSPLDFFLHSGHIF